MSEVFIFPEALESGTWKQAEVWKHGGCPYCDRIWALRKKYPRWTVVWNRNTRDLVAVIPWKS